MKPLHLFLGLIVLLSACFTTPLPAILQKEPTLTAEDKKYLDGLMKDFLFDPKRAERVVVKTVVRTVWASSTEVQVGGWFVPGKEGKPGRVFFTDGAAILALPEAEMQKVDFASACKARYGAAPVEKKDDLDHNEIFSKMKQTAIGAVGDHDLALAAWLYRLGHEGLAARALAAARKGKDDPRRQLRSELAWSAFAAMIHAYMVRADDEALDNGQRLLRLYANDDKDKEYSQATLVVAELKRRQLKGTFGKVPSEKWPDGFDKWDAKKKATYLIDTLEEVDARQWGQPGGVDLASDRRVQELIRLGDSAVPGLIEALDKDERLTRAVHFWRDFARSRTVLSVREAALTALMSILRVRVFEPAATGDNFTSRGDDAAKALAKQLRSYWKEYGHLPFDERMMKVLTDPKTKFEAKREAAENLARLTEERNLQTTIYPTVIGAEPPPKPNPAVAKFSQPTAAEAILAAMDADLKAFDANSPKDMVDYYRRGIEGTYLWALVDLGDKRIAPELARRATAAQAIRARRQWAEVAHYLGDPKTFGAFAEDFRSGKIELPVGEGADGELCSIVSSLINVGTPEADRALNALADPKHPQHQAVTHQVLTQNLHGFDDGPWFAHPFCLRILRKALDDMTPTGATYLIEKDRLVRKTADGWSGGGIPDFLADPASRREQAAERACDAAAEKVAELVVGLPHYHPLFKDADQRLGALKVALDHFDGNYRRLGWRERDILGVSVWLKSYMPDIRPLKRGATAADVKAGKAIFHFDGKGKAADLKLPAVAAVKNDDNTKQPERLLIVQAEISPNGELTFGVITRHATRMVPASYVTDIRTFADLEREEREAAAKEKAKKK